ncbi:MAG: HTH-type transcriptional regulator GbpR [Pseudomonas citronellolis]|nr:MAG: HTH-type transcriptional regulator GbpR [Pseudomonas citronellolis]
MDLHQLRHFVALAEHGNFTRAAEASFITQSAFSRSIQTLEQNLGCQLVERGNGGRGLSLTVQGRALQRRARELLDGVSSLRADLVGLDRDTPAVLGLGSGPLPAARLVPAALAEFVDAHPTARIDLRVDNPDHLKQLLDNGDVEFVVADLRHMETSKGYVTRALRPRRFQLFCRRGHPLLRGQPPRFSELADYALGCSSLPAELRVLLSERAGRAALPINLECKHSDVLLQMVVASDLIGIAAEDLVAQVQASGAVQVLEFADAPQGLALGGTCFGVAHRADRQLSALAERLIDSIARIDARYVPAEDRSGRPLGVAV